MLHRFHRAVPLVSLLALLLLVTAVPAEAYLGWCARDPVVRIGGQRANVWVSSPNEILEAVTGPTLVRFVVPEGVPTELIATDDGFGWNPAYDVQFVESDRLQVTNLGIEIKVVVRVPADAALPIVVDVADRDEVVLASGTGITNSPIVTRTTL